MLDRQSPERLKLSCFKVSYRRNIDPACTNLAYMLRASRNWVKTNDVTRPTGRTECAYECASSK